MKTSVFLFSMAAALAIGMGATDALGKTVPIKARWAGCRHSHLLARWPVIG